MEPRVRRRTAAAGIVIAGFLLAVAGAVMGVDPVAAQCPNPNDPNDPNCLPCEQTNSCTATPGPQDCGPNNPCTEAPPDQPSPTRRPTSTLTSTPTDTPPPAPSTTATATRSSTPRSTATSTATPSPTLTSTPTPSGIRAWIGSLSTSLTGLTDRVGGWLDLPTRTPTPVPVDLEIVKIEITQGIQCLNNSSCPDNSVRLSERRPTLIRAYVRMNSGPAFLTGVSGTLCQGSVYDRGCPFPIRPLNPITVERVVGDPASFFRPSLKATLNFIVPAEWIASPASFFLSVNVNPSGETAKETTYDNNSIVHYAEFTRRRKADIVFVPFVSNGWAATYDDVGPIVAWLQRALPTNDIRIWTTGLWLAKDYAFNDRSIGGCGAGWSSLLDGLHRFRGRNWQIYYGMVTFRSLQPGSAAGCGRYGGAYVAGGRTGTGDRRPGQIAAQELGHDYERRHAPGFGAGDPDPGFPTSDGTIDEFGVDIVLMQLYKPGVDFDYMGYGGSENSMWTSLYTWRALEALYPLASAPPTSRLASPSRHSEVEAEFLVASGIVAPDSASLDDGFFRVWLPAELKDALPDGPYTLEQVGADGSVLRARPFAPAHDSNAAPSDSGTFLIREPWIAGTVAVTIRYQGTQLLRQELSPHPPTVRLLEPNGGEAWGAGPQTVRWEASDADGDDLRFVVEYSRDGGATWDEVTLPGTQTSLALDATYLPGSSAARIRILASDGLNTISDDSDETFSVSNKAPLVFLTSPEEGHHVTQGTPLILMAAGTDPEDGPIPPEDLEWTSDLEGALGAGEFRTTSDLEPGEHILTVSASDGSGQTVTRHVRVIVDPAPEPEGRSLESGQGSTAVPAAIGALLVVIAGLVIWRRTRRRSA